MEKAGFLAIEALYYLESLYIGGNEESIGVGDTGVALSWPWTGRLDEWAYEQFPDCDYDKGEL